MSEDNDVLTGRKIQYFIFREERHDVKEWSEMQWEMAQILYSINPSVLYQEAARGNVWIGSIQHSKNYKKLAEGLYFCPTSSSTSNKMSILKNLFDLYGIDYDDLSFGLLPKKETEEEAQYFNEDGEKVAPRHYNRKQFWGEFIKYCEDNNGLFTNLSPVSSSWISKSIKVPYGVKMVAVIRYDLARIEVYFDSGDESINKPLFDYLYSKKEEIESEYGAPLIWQRLNGKTACRIKDEIACRPFEIADRTDIYKFMKESSDKMSVIFRNHILQYNK